MSTPDFTKYTKDHWSCLLYIESVVVDHKGKPDHRKMNEADRDAADEMERHGLIIWGGTGIYPIFKLTDRGWAVAHAVRRARAEEVHRTQWAFIAATEYERATVAVRP